MATPPPAARPARSARSAAVDLPRLGRAAESASARARVSPIGVDAPRPTMPSGAMLTASAAPAVGGQRVVGADPAAAAVVRSPVSRPVRPRRAGARSPRRSAWRCRSRRRARRGSAAAAPSARAARARRSASAAGPATASPGPSRRNSSKESCLNRAARLESISSKESFLEGDADRRQHRAAAVALPALPHWETTPDDLPAAIRRDQGRAAGPHRGLRPHGRGGLRRHRGAGRGARSTEIAAAQARGETVWPVIDYADIAAGTVTAGRRWRSCAAAAAWSCAATSPASRRWPGTAASSTTSSATGSSRTTAARATTSSAASAPSPRSTRSTGHRPRCRPGRATGWPASRRSSTASGSTSPTACSGSTPTATRLYPDRIRRRPPGADSAGLGTHLDPGTLDLWMTQAYQQAFRHLFDGTVEQYDPWDAAHRTAGPQYPGTTMCSAFRTFQGWTALSDMDHDQGVLHTVPIPEAMALPDAAPAAAPTSPDDDMCGVTVNQVFPASEKWHPLLLQALSRHPRRPGRRLGLVALRHDPQRRAGHRPAGLGQRHVHPRRPLVPAQRALRRQRPRGLPHRLQPERLPRRALRAHLAQPLPARTTSTPPAAAASASARPAGGQDLNPRPAATLSGLAAECDGRPGTVSRQHYTSRSRWSPGSSLPLRRPGARRSRVRSGRRRFRRSRRSPGSNLAELPR